jgi:VanZ family protein
MLLFCFVVFLAALPMIAVFVFLEVNAAKQETGSQIKDKYRKLAHVLGYILVTLIMAFLIYLACTENPHYGSRSFIGLIDILKFLAKLFT